MSSEALTEAEVKMRGDKSGLSAKAGEQLHLEECWFNKCELWCRRRLFRHNPGQSFGSETVAVQIITF